MTVPLEPTDSVHPYALRSSFSTTGIRHREGHYSPLPSFSSPRATDTPPPPPPPPHLPPRCAIITAPRSASLSAALPACLPACPPCPADQHRHDHTYVSLLHPPEREIRWDGAVTFTTSSNSVALRYFTTLALVVWWLFVSFSFVFLMAALSLRCSCCVWSACSPEGTYVLYSFIFNILMYCPTLFIPFFVGGGSVTNLSLLLCFQIYG